MSVRRYVVFLSALFLLSLLLSPWGALSFDLLFFGLLTAFLARFSVPLPLVGEVRLHYLGALALAYSASPGWAGLLSALALPFASRPPSLLREAFNRSQVGLAALLAAHAYGAVGGLPGALLGAGVYFAANTGAMLLLTWWEATPAWRTREAFAQASREVVL